MGRRIEEGKSEEVISTLLNAGTEYMYTGSSRRKAMCGFCRQAEFRHTCFLRGSRHLENIIFPIQICPKFTLDKESSSDKLIIYHYTWIYRL